MRIGIVGAGMTVPWFLEAAKLIPEMEVWALYVRKEEKRQELCEKYQVPVVMDSDAHFDLLIGEFDRARDLLEKLDFPEELVLNRSADAIREYVNRKF